MTDIIAVDNLQHARQVRATSPTARSPTTSTRASSSQRLRQLRRRGRGGAAPGRVLRHHGERRPLHDGEQLPLLEDAARLVPGRTRCRSSTRRRRRCTAAGAEFREERALRAAAQRLRLLEVPVRPASCAARCRGKTAQIAGFRYFNVYGPHEAHKGRMASVAFHAYQPAPRHGKVQAVRGLGGYGNGEQRRDFVYVDDVVDVNLWFLEHRERIGHLQLRHRPRADLQRARRGDDQRGAGHRAHRARARAAQAHRVHPVSRRALKEQVPELHPGGPVAAARGGLSRRVHDRRAGRRRLRRTSCSNA